MKYISDSEKIILNPKKFEVLAPSVSRMHKYGVAGDNSDLISCVVVRKSRDNNCPRLRVKEHIRHGVWFYSRG